MGSDGWDIYLKAIIACAFLGGCVISFLVSFLLYIWFIQ